MTRFFLSIFFIGFAIISVVQGIVNQLSGVIFGAFGLYLIAVLLIIISYFVYKQASHMLKLLDPS